MVWDPSQTQQTLQPNVQLINHPGQSLVYGPTQQPIQPTIQIPAFGTVQQCGTSSPCTPPQTTATFVQPTTPISGVSAAPVSTTPASEKIPQVSVPQSGPTV